MIRPDRATTQVLAPQRKIESVNRSAELGRDLGEVSQVTEGGVNNYYPQFSPDGKWILFNRGMGDIASNTGIDQPQEVWAVAANGQSQPIRLSNANTSTNLVNTWPRWTRSSSPLASSVTSTTSRSHRSATTASNSRDCTNRDAQWTQAIVPTIN